MDHKVFLVFAGNYEAEGGAFDFYSLSYNFTDAKRVTVSLLDQYDWAHIAEFVDGQLTVVLSGEWDQHTDKLRWYPESV